MKKLFIVTPNEDLVHLLDIQNKIKSDIHQGVFLLNTYFRGYKELSNDLKSVTNTDVFNLSRMVEILALSDLLYFDSGFEKSETCLLLYNIATRYNIPIYNNVEV
jgi:hypothetical protein